MEVVEWSRFPTGQAFTSYIELTPGEYSSGETVQRGHITRSGNPILRTALVEASWTLVRKDAVQRAHFEKLKKRAGAKKAIVAVARKLGHALVAMHRDGVPYRHQLVTK